MMLVVPAITVAEAEKLRVLLEGAVPGRRCCKGFRE